MGNKILGFIFGESQNQNCGSCANNYSGQCHAVGGWVGKPDKVKSFDSCGGLEYKAKK